jgi:hypothetical protein
MSLMVHIWNPSTFEAEAGRSQVQSQMDNIVMFCPNKQQQKSHKNIGMMSKE